MTGEEVKTIDDYIHGFPEEVRKRLEEVRSFIRKQVPEPGEAISYSIPSITFWSGQKPAHGLMFAGYAKHIGIYPKAAPIEHFKSRLEEMGLKYSKGAIQFPHNKPLPTELLKDIINFMLIHGKQYP